MLTNYITFNLYQYFQSVIDTPIYFFKCLVGTITYFLHNTTKEIFTPQSGALGTSQTPGTTNLTQELTAFQTSQLVGPQRLVQEVIPQWI